MAWKKYSGWQPSLPLVARGLIVLDAYNIIQSQVSAEFITRINVNSEVESETYSC
jgi:hypothetical protein